MLPMYGIPIPKARGFQKCANFPSVPINRVPIIRVLLYIVFSLQVVEGLRGTNPALEALLDDVYAEAKRKRQQHVE